MKCENRESWLNYVALRMRPMFDNLGVPLPDKVRIAIGFTSNGTRGRRIGECWDNRCSVDGYFEIFIRPDLAESPDAMPGKVAAILAHELVHAAVGIRAGHGPLFRRVAKGLGLTGKMTATVAGPKFDDAIASILCDAGSLPHGRLKTRNSIQPHDDSYEDRDSPGESGPRPRTYRSETPEVSSEIDYPLSTSPKRQTRRHIKCQCIECGYTVRTSRKWLDTAGPPHCPIHKQMSVIEDGSSPDDDD